MSAGRKPLPIGTYGEIATKQQPSGSWRASTQYRDRDGVTRGVERRGPTKAAAKRIPKTYLLERQAPSQRGITGDTRIETLLEKYVTKVRFEKSKKPQTIAKDEGIIRAQINPRIGNLAVREVNVPILDELFMAKDVTASNARLMRIVLTGALQLAVSHGAIHVNPVPNATKIAKIATEVLAMEVEQLVTLRSAIDAYAGSNRLGPKIRVENLRDVFDLLFATGFRINECLALRWSDVNWEKNSVTVTGMLIRIKGEGIQRQDQSKTKSGHREVVLPAFGMDVLRRRRDTYPPNDLDAVFVTSKGTWVSANNLRTQWRKIREEVDLTWVAPHILRETVGTLLGNEISPKDASEQLGHKSEKTTLESYIKAAARESDNSEILAKLGPNYTPEAN